MRHLPRIAGCATSIVIAAAFATGHAGHLREPVPAPEWAVSEWLNGDPGSLADQRGRVVLIDFFQLWCPGCRRFSIPLFQRWDEKYGDRDDVLILSIHTVFEGHDQQTPERLREFIETWKITHPVGVDAYEKGDETPTTMRRYRTGGTPHVVIIDKTGRIVFSHFGSFNETWAESFIDALLAGETVPRKPDRPTRSW